MKYLAKGLILVFAGIVTALITECDDINIDIDFKKQ